MMLYLDAIFYKILFNVLVLHYIDLFLNVIIYDKLILS